MVNTIAVKTDSDDLLVDHYQKTYEITYTFWRQRNTLFLLLVAAVGVAALLTIQGTASDNILLYALASALDITDPQERAELRGSFPFGVLRIVFPVLVFYLMVNLYHRAVYVQKNYHYLNLLEREIRQKLQIAPEEHFFTREGDFYWNDRSVSLGAVKFVYILILLALLVLFFSYRMVDTRQLLWSGEGFSIVLGVVDVFVAVTTFYFFAAYAWSAYTGDWKPSSHPEPESATGVKAGVDRWLSAHELISTLLLTCLSAAAAWMLSGVVSRDGGIAGVDGDRVRIGNNLMEMYYTAVRDAQQPSSDEVSENLTAVVQNNDRLRWKPLLGRQYVLTVSWIASPRQLRAGDVWYIGGRNPSVEEGIEGIWVTVVPELQEFCQTLDLPTSEMTLRLEQLLGLPPNSGKTYMIEMWVDPSDLFRPSPDPEITDQVAELDFPRSDRFVVIDPRYRSWFLERIGAVYRTEGEGARPYPWTRLGYTYDWSGEGEIGLSEFVVRKGAAVRVEAIETTDEYCR